MTNRIVQAIHRKTGVLLALAFLAAVAVGGCGVPAANGPCNTYNLDFSLPYPSQPAQGAVVFLVDGVNADIFQQMLDAGELPAIKKYFVDRGLYAPRAVGNIPSITLVSFTSITTGVYPGHHGIVGNNWFDRNQLVWRNYETIAQKNMLDADYKAPTIYEMFPDGLTFSLFFQPHRGATKFFENWTSAGPPFFFGWYEYVDRLTLYRLGQMMDISRQYSQFPAITMVYQLSVDFRAYGCGVSSPQYRQAIRHTDCQIGRVLGDMDRAGLLDKVIIALVSDHGLSDVRNHFHIDKLLSKQAGLNLATKHLWEKTPFEDRLKEYDRHAGVLYGSGDKYSAICLRKPSGDANNASFAPWLDRPSMQDLQNYPTAKGRTDLISLLVQQDAVDAVAYRGGPGCVRVRRKCGLVEFAQPGGPGHDISYRAISGGDVLGLEGKVSQEVLNGKPMSPAQWLEVTAATDFPDLPAQILAYFRSGLSGDIALFAADGWDFNDVNRAGHGDIGPASMHVPLIIAGPGVLHGTLPTARTVDLVPTLLGLLNRPIPPGLDGRNLLDKANVPKSEPASK